MSPQKRVLVFGVPTLAVLIFIGHLLDVKHIQMEEYVYIVAFAIVAVVAFAIWLPRRGKDVSR